MICGLKKIWIFKAFRRIVFKDTLWSHQPIQVSGMWIKEIRQYNNIDIDIN
jgi:hypothetical protein